VGIVSHSARNLGARLGVSFLEVIGLLDEEILGLHLMLLLRIIICDLLANGVKLSSVMVPQRHVVLPDTFRSEVARRVSVSHVT
jgi:hypothetical protein